MAKEGMGKTMIENQTDNQYELQLSAILVALLLNTLFFLFIFCLYQQERSAAPFISPSFDAHEDIMITIQPDAPTPVSYTHLDVYKRQGWQCAILL